MGPNGVGRHAIHRGKLAGSARRSGRGPDPRDAERDLSFFNSAPLFPHSPISTFPHFHIPGIPRQFSRNLPGFQDKGGSCDQMVPPFSAKYLKTSSTLRFLRILTILTHFPSYAIARTPSWIKSGPARLRPPRKVQFCDAKHPPWINGCLLGAIFLEFPISRRFPEFLEGLPPLLPGSLPRVPPFSAKYPKTSSTSRFPIF